MRRAIGIVLAAACFAAGTSLAMAQNGEPTGGYPPAAGGANGYPGPVSPYYGTYNYAAPYTAGTYYDYAGPYATGSYSGYATPYVVAPSYGYATPYYGTYNYAAPYYAAPGPGYSYGYFGPRWR